MAQLLASYVAFGSPHACVAITLWSAHTWVVDSFDSTPRLVLVSPEKQSGKTRTLEVLELLVRAPRLGVNLSVAAMFRLVGAEQPTLLFDEADTFFGPKAKEHEELRGLINAGHRKGQDAFRCVGEKQEPRAFPSYTPVAMAAIGDLPDTITDRAVVINMRRRAQAEHIEPFRLRVARAQTEPLVERLREWAKSAPDVLAEAWPDTPESLTDRASDVWQPLLAVADMAGGEWPERARGAAISLNADRQAADISLGVRLLGDIGAVFGADDKVSTITLLGRLNSLEEAPWGNIRGEPLDARGLARRLQRYGIHPHPVWVAGATVKGYERADFADSWARYTLPPISPTTVRAVRSVGSPEPEQTLLTDLTVPGERGRGRERRLRAGRLDDHVP